jgi:NTE family protein
MAVTAPGAGTDSRLSLVLSGGNALGAYHLGACRVLLGSGREPDWVVGASIGAVTGAILVGNPPETRLDRLAAFWRQAAQPQPWHPMRAIPEAFRARINNVYAAAALGLGRPGLFSQRLPGLLSLLPWVPADHAAEDHHLLAATLARLIDFDRLNAAEQRFSIVALDVETGEEIWFDTPQDRIEVEHLLASTALMPLFPPVEIGGRLLCDPGLANNLPLDRVFRDPLTADHLCIAIDLYDLGHDQPRTLDQSAARAQDLIFASQSRRTIESVERLVQAWSGAEHAGPAVTIAQLAFRAPGHQRTLKPLDFSPASLDERIRQGAIDMEAMLRRLERDAPVAGFKWMRNNHWG